MNIERDIEAIRKRIVEGRYQNEASISQGIILPLLQSLE